MLKEWALREAQRIDAQRAWRTGDTREEPGDGQEVVNGFAIVSNERLHLRFVIDRAVHHLDIGCLDETGLRRWVPFEIVGFAAGLWNKADYEKARRQGLDSVDLDAECPTPVPMFRDPSAQVGAHVDEIVAAADDWHAVREAEATISEMNTQILDSLDLVEDLGAA